MGQVLRRQFLMAASALLAAPRTARAQRAEKMHRVAWVLTVSPVAELAGPDPAHPITRAFVHELRALGYEEGRNLILDRRSAEGQPERYAEIIKEMVRLDADVIVSAGNSGLNRQAKAVTNTVPIVIFGMNNPDKAGLVASLARPGGNITGVSVNIGAETEAKRLQLLKEALPSASRVAYLGPKAALDTPYAKAAQSVAPSLGIELVPVEHVVANLDATFAAVKSARADALFVALSAVAYGQRQQIVEFARSARLPAMFPYLVMVGMGGLMGYGIDVVDLGRRAAHYVDKILKGAKPGDLPIEQPTKFNLVINMKTAKALGITFPPSILIRADKVIE